MSTDGEFTIELNGVTKMFGAARAVDRLTLSVRQGEKLALIGPNGAGKSTTIKMLAGLMSVSTGSIRVLGRDPRDNPEHKPVIGYVPENHLMYRWMRVDEVIAFCRALYPAWDDGLCGRLVERFELAPQKRVRHLSKGMLAKLSLTLALAHQPRVLLLDEPTSGLDPLIREEFLEGILDAVCTHERTLVLSSHTLSDVQRVADTIGIIAGGRLLTCRPAEELISQTKRVRAVLSDGATPGAPPPGTVWQTIDRREWLLTVSDCSHDTLARLRALNPVAQVDVFDLTLEDIFKDYVRGARSAS
ncbi:ABC transporter ATP-binding protein YtrB [Phycisphaerae bacterium RAS1]|nr:ABC transporter ATP-binding protein YtrB [Phycisphaerae bacterium RAS1]